MSDIRVRFAPSPTGYLHIGGVRTALFNWLWARKNGGKFVLRIEDTDQERSTPESCAIILESLKWLGMDWDEGPEVGGDYGPYTQMERLDLYKHYADKLISEGEAYKCYCTKEDLDAARAVWREKYGDKIGFKYPGTCRNRKDVPDSKDYVVRLKTPTDGVIEYDDKVFGKVVTPNKENQDFILMRSDGVPLYNFGAVIDDMTMGMTLVARGRDHMINTPPQILIYNALGVRHPEFAHLPMMLNQKGAKLSKRDGAVGVFEYRDAGYSPASVLNYLVRFGWSHGNQEVFSLKELIDSFSWESCGKNDGRFDPKKFASIQFEHLKSKDLTSDKEYAHHTIPFLYERGIGDISHDKVEHAIYSVRDKAKTFIDAADLLDTFFRAEPVVDQIAANKFLVADSMDKVQALTEALSNVNLWNEANLRIEITSWLEQHNMVMKDVGQPLRVALTGRSTSPELYQVMTILGKDKSLSRIKTAISNARGA